MRGREEKFHQFNFFFIFIFFLISWKTFFRHFLGSLLQQLRQKSEEATELLMPKNNPRLHFGSFPGLDLWNHQVSTFAEVTDWVTWRTSDGKTQFEKLTSKSWKFRRDKVNWYSWSFPPFGERPHVQIKLLTCLHAYKKWNSLTVPLKYGLKVFFF